MDDAGPTTPLGPTQLFLVEAYTGGGATPTGLPVDDGASVDTVDPSSAVIGVIDIPGDHAALYLVLAGDVAAAVRATRRGAIVPIRVVPARWRSGTAPWTSGPAERPSP